MPRCLQLSLVCSIDANNGLQTVFRNPRANIVNGRFAEQLHDVEVFAPVEHINFFLVNRLMSTNQKPNLSLYSP